MKQRLGGGEGATARGAVGEISRDDVYGKVLQVAAIGAGAHQGTDLPTRPHEGPGDRRADEARCACDQRHHDMAASGTIGNACRAGVPARATAPSERPAARYRGSNRMSAARSPGAITSEAIRRPICQFPTLPAAAITARGRMSAAVSTVTH